MNITQLRAFLAVVDLGSFSDAARQIGVSQPAVTMQIKALEAEVGATLLDRRYHRVELTGAGAALLPRARSVIADLAQAREDIAALSDTLTGRLVIAASTTPGDYLVPCFLGGFLKANPQVQVEIDIYDTAAATAVVESGHADLAVCGAKEPSAKLEFRELGMDELVLICPPSHRLAGKTDVAATELVEEGWVGRESGSGTDRIVRQALRDRGVDADELRLLVELGTGDSIVCAVIGGLGIAMVSRFVADKAVRLGEVGVIGLAGPRITRPFYTVLPKSTPSRSAAAFEQYLRERASFSA